MPDSDPSRLLAQAGPRRGRPPLERWQPPLSGDIDIRIDRDGRWWHEGRPIEREALVQLFAGILRREADGGHYLVTPIEKWRITVEDAPLLAGPPERLDGPAGPRLRFTTSVGDVFDAGPQYPIEVEYRGDEPRPYLHVHHGLRARLTRAAFVELAGLAEPASLGGREVLGVYSDGAFFVLGPAGEGGELSTD
ncbi:MAG TPA: DUF1285 domain-containing protein, partial [Plasticicumulans sp.]|nr:DUF1285 domain-containing protein [Plasticicumulans sp.]